MKPYLKLLLDAATETERVAFLDALRALLSPAAPKNKSNQAMVSDLDMICASDEQHAAAAETAGLISPALRAAQKEAAAFTEKDLEHDLQWDRRP